MEIEINNPLADTTETVINDITITNEYNDEETNNTSDNQDQENVHAILDNAGVELLN